MIAFVTVQHRARYLAQVHTSAGALIGQAVDIDKSAARKRAVRQAYRWAVDYGWKLTIRNREVT